MPSVSLAFHPESAAEYAEAYQWYVERSSDIAAAFAEEISRALRLVRQTPERWPRYSARHRRILVRRFPYSVVYLTTRSAFGLWPWRTRGADPGTGVRGASRDNDRRQSLRPDMAAPIVHTERA